MFLTRIPTARGPTGHQHQAIQLQVAARGREAERREEGRSGWALKDRKIWTSQDCRGEEGFQEQQEALQVPGGGKAAGLRDRG